jgi:hypothetical protein
MPPKNKKNGKRQEAEVASAQTDEDFDDMLAEVMAADLTTFTGDSTSSSSITTSATTPQALSSASNTANSTPGATASSSSSSSSTSRPEVSEAIISDAVRAGDLTRLRRWGQLGVRCDFARPLCLAAMLGNVAVVECLIKEIGAEVDRVYEGGASPIHVAAQEGKLDVVLCLVKEFGADANRPNNRGVTPMCAAAMNGHLDVVCCLVRDFGADLNHADKGGSTALMAASYGKHAELVKWLVKEGADPLKEMYGGGSRAADLSRVIGASVEQTAYLEAKTHCSNTSCSGAGIMKCTGCMQARYCKEECQQAHWQAHKADCKRWSAGAKVGKGN